MKNLKLFLLTFALSAILMPFVVVLIFVTMIYDLFKKDGI